MSFLEHLEELRWRLVKSSAAILVFGIVAFISKKFIFDVILFGPRSSSFHNLPRVLLALQPNWNGRQIVHGKCRHKCSKHRYERTVLNPYYGLDCSRIYHRIPLCLISIVGLSKTRIKKKERDSARGIVFFSSMLFFLGVIVRLLCRSLRYHCSF